MHDISCMMQQYGDWKVLRVDPTKPSVTILDILAERVVTME